MYPKDVYENKTSQASVIYLPILPIINTLLPRSITLSIMLHFMNFPVVSNIILHTYQE